MGLTSVQQTALSAWSINPIIRDRIRYRMFKVSFQPYSRSFAIPLKTAHGVWSIREGIIVALMDEQGRVGLGEIAPLPWFGSETMEEAIDFLSGLCGVIEDWRTVPDSLPCCQFAFEMAIAPPAVKSSEGLEIQKDLEKQFAGLLPTGLSALTQWEALYVAGVRSFKWKIGTAGINEELELFRQLCDRLPHDALLRLDANGGLSLAEARQWLEECDRQRCVEFLEQPLGIDCFDELLSLSHEFTTLLALDESIATYIQLEDCYARGWRDVYVIKPAIAGYPSRLEKFCLQHSIDRVFSSVFESSVGFQNAFQVANTIGSDRALGFGTRRYFEGLEPVGSLEICEKDPIEFLVKFWSAIASNHHIFLKNPTTPNTSNVGCIKRSNASFVSPIQTINIPTSGTTHHPKYATHTLTTLSNSVQATQHHLQTSQINSLCVLPLHHVSGLMQHLRSHLTQGQLILWDWKKLENGHFPDIKLETFHLSLVPTQLQRLIHQPELQRLKAILLGGAPPWASLLQKARTQNLPIALTYGMTETASQIASLTPDEFRSGRLGVGKPLPHATIEIRNDLGLLCEPGETGHLTIEATSRMLGYFPRRDTETIFRPDDLGYFDSQGYLHIVGRSSDKIITGGENVYPSEIEAAIRRVAPVQDLCVIGVDDETWGQIIVAVYVSPLDIDLNRDLEQSLPKFKHPKHWIRVEAIPRNPLGKIDHSSLLQLIQVHLS